MALLGTGGVHGDGVLAVYMEVVPKHCVVGYWRCTWRCSLSTVLLDTGGVTWRWALSAVLLGTGGVHGGGPCPLKYCVTGY